MKHLRMVILMMLIAAFVALTGCSAKDGMVTDDSLSPTLPTVTSPAATIPAATVPAPTTPADNGILSTESPSAEVTATAAPQV